MFSMNVGGRRKGDISVARRSMVTNSAGNANSGDGSQSQPEVIDLVSDTNAEEEDEDEEEVVEVNGASESRCMLVLPHRQKGRDINDNTGNGSGDGPVEKRATLFERRSYHSDRSPSFETSGPSGASFSRLSIYRRQSIHSSPDQRPAGWPSATASWARNGETSSTATSGIILNRAYNKTPVLGANKSARSFTDSRRMSPVVCLSDIRKRLSMPGNGLSSNRHDNDRAETNTTRNCSPRTSLLRRSFHKPHSSPTSGCKIPTIDLVSIPVASTSVQSGTRQMSSPSVPIEVLDSPPRAVAAEGPTADVVETMDIVEVDEVCERTETISSSSSSDIEFFSAVQHNTKVSLEKGSPKVNAPAETVVSNAIGEEQEKEEEQEEEVAEHGSSMGHSYGDVSSSGCLKVTSTRNSVGRRQGVQIGAGGRQPLNEFDLMLLKINQTVPPMSNQDRIDQWRVTADDLLHSIPTKASIETTSTCTKRPLDATVHISSDEDSDNLDNTEGPFGASRNKKQRTLEGEREETSETPMKGSSVNSGAAGEASCLDFRKSQINPEIDKPPSTSMILQRRNYHKLPTRFRQCGETHRSDASSVQRENAVRGRSAEVASGGTDRPVANGHQSPNPYAQLLSRDEERDKFLSYLKISPFFRTDEKALLRARGMGTRETPSSSEFPSLNDGLSKGTADGNSRAKMAHGKPPQAKRQTKERRNRKEKRKKPLKAKTHPSVIASSGIRGVRRLVLASSLRSGKVIRYRNNILHLKAKPNVRSAKHGQTSAPEREDECVDGEKMDAMLLTDSTVATATAAEPLEDVKRKKQRSASEAAAAAGSSPSFEEDKKSSKDRCSVDSAVSSSTSAEMRHDESKRSKECQTVMTVPPLANVVIKQTPPPTSPAPALNDGKRLRNPVARSDGEVLHVFLIDEQLIVVQKELVSFWKYSRLTVLLGVKQDWQLVGRIQRWNRDTEVDTQNGNRVVYKASSPIYLEPRARDLNDDKSRACPLASIYVNAYFLHHMSRNTPAPPVPLITFVNVDTGFVTSDGYAEVDDDGNMNGSCGDADDEQQQLRMKSYQLNTVKSALGDIRMVPLPNTERDFLVCWHEHVSEMESRTGLCKYTVTPDLETVGCIREFAVVKQRLYSLRCINDRKLLGLGVSTLHIWCYESGYLLRVVDLNIEIGLIMCAFLHIELDENTLIMLQLLQPSSPESECHNKKLVKVIAVNLDKRTWYTAHSYEISLVSMSITSESPIWDADKSDIAHRHCVTFDSGELLLVSLADPSACWTNYQRLEKDLLRASEVGSVNICSRLRGSNGSHELYRPRERILNAANWNGGRDLVFLSEQLLTTKSIEEYMMERAKYR